MNVSHIIFRIQTSRKKPLVIIGGSTASGKTSCAITIAQQLIAQGIQAEIISADSRQIYKDVPIFSGAVTKQEMSGIRHHLVGTEQIRVARSADWFRHECLQIIQQVHNRGAIPIVAGGSAFWIQSILFQDDYPKVETNEVLRKELEQLSLVQLQTHLQELDPKRFTTMDIQNPRRLIRSIEIATSLGSVPHMNFTPSSRFKTHLIYFDLDREVLQEKIRKNVEKRYSLGLIDEARRVYNNIDPKRFTELGLAYKYMQDFWAGDMIETELQNKTVIEECRYAKRQKTFFNKIIEKVLCRKYIICNNKQRERVIQHVVKQLI